MSKRTRKKSEGSGVRKKREGKNLDRDGRLLNMDKFGRQCLDPIYHNADQSNDLWAFHEKDRRDRKGRLNRLKRAEAYALADSKKDRPDVFKTPLLEVVLKDLYSAKILQALFTAAALKFVVKSGWPFFFVKRLHKMDRPISLEGVVIV